LRGLFFDTGLNALLRNTTFVDNTAYGSNYGTYGGAIALGWNGPNYNLINTVMWNNTPNAISVLANSGNIEITYSDIQGGEAEIQYHFDADAGNVNWGDGKID
jgi:hypothetical protein